jgi:autotransporter-associated beta strand protein
MTRHSRPHGFFTKAMLLSVVLSPLAAQATTVSWFTDQTAFESQLQAGFFNSFAPAAGEQTSPQMFSSGGWSFEATADGGLYGLSGVVGGGERGLQPLNFSTPLVLSMFSPVMTGFGATFSLRDEFEVFASGTLQLNIFTASDGLASGTNFAVGGSAGVFRGLIISGTAAISKVELTALTSPQTLLPTVQGIVVGAASSTGGPITIDVPAGTLTQVQAGFALLSGTTPVQKTGAGTVVFDQANTLTGPTTVTQGTLQLAKADGLFSSAVTVAAGAALTVGPQVAAVVPALVNNGVVDVGLGGLMITAGQNAAGIVAGIVAGRADGAWTGTAGITSSAAATQGERAVGWLDNGDGSFTVAFAAAGDWNLNGVVDFDDVVQFVSANLYDTGLPAMWADGDYDYNGVVDFDDVVASVSANLFDTGPYNAPPAGSGLSLAAGPSGIVAVPEPPTSALSFVVLAIVARSMRMKRARRGGRPHLV